jgi:hypothetical protein
MHLSDWSANSAVTWSTFSSKFPKSQINKAPIYNEYFKNTFVSRWFNSEMHIDIYYLGNIF